MVVVDLRTNHLSDPMGLDTSLPLLSWTLSDPTIGARQSAFQIQVAASEQDLDVEEARVWDSGRVDSDRTTLVPYTGPACTAWQRCLWRVRVWDGQGDGSEWSTVASWEMGPLAASDWQAAWIGGTPRTGQFDEPSPYLRREFSLDDAPVSARLAVTARGCYELWLNGDRVGDAVLTPGWTDHRVRIPYQVYDVTDRLVPGANCLGGILADGWYAGKIGARDGRHLGGRDVSMLVSLRLVYADGRTEQITSNDQWHWHTGAILSADLYDGERYDARLEPRGWCEPGFDDADWRPVVCSQAPSTALVAKSCADVRRIEELSAQARTEPEPGRWVYDLGQNMVGWARIRLTAPAGTVVTLRHAEILDEHGAMYTENLSHAKCTDVYVCAGNGEDVYEPRFTFHGFRYVEVTGLSDPLPLEAVTGVVLHTDMPETGTFECSNAMVNQLQSNIRWGQKGNFLEVPTDCPQRDERLGWSGDAQVFARTACFNMDAAAFLTKYVQDLVDAQTPEGRFPDVAPDVWGNGGHAAWGDAGVIIPWTIFLCYGDVSVLDRYFDAMARWVDFMETESDELIRPEDGFGDWLSVDGTEPDTATTSKALIGTAYFARCADRVSRAAELTGRSEKAASYRDLHGRVVAAFNREFVTPAGRLVSHSQTAYLLALAFDLLPEDKRAMAVAHLVADIESRDWHLSTGFVGTPLLAPVLTKVGRSDVAYKLLLQDSYPSWFCSIHNGSTTMWERWNSYTKEDGFCAHGMNSFNHYAYGAIGEWLYATVGGLGVDPELPGYKHAIIAPEPGGDLIWAKASLESAHGTLTCRWDLKDNGLTVAVTVPPNTTATLRLPPGWTRDICINDTSATSAAGVSQAAVADDRFTCELQAGPYQVSAAR